MKHIREDIAQLLLTQEPSLALMKAVFASSPIEPKPTYHEFAEDTRVHAIPCCSSYSWHPERPEVGVNRLYEFGNSYETHKGGPRTLARRWHLLMLIEMEMNL